VRGQRHCARWWKARSGCPPLATSTRRRWRELRACYHTHFRTLLRIGLSARQTYPSTLLAASDAATIWKVTNMDPLIRGLFEDFKRTEELLAMPDGDAFELFASSLALSEELLAQAELSSLLLDPGTPGIDLLAIEIN